MDARIAREVSLSDLFEEFIDASSMRSVLSLHHRILNYADLSPCEYNLFFPKFKRAIMTDGAKKNWKAKALFSKLEKKALLKCYSNVRCTNSEANEEGDPDSSPIKQIGNNVLRDYNCLVIGSGPAGLRSAIELQLLGANKVMIVEKRSRFSRNNVLHLWPFVIDDLKSLGAKKFYGKFCAGSIDHISIRQLELILLKVCLMIGCDFRDSCAYLHLCPSTLKQGSGDIKETNGDNRQDQEVRDSTKLLFEDQKCDIDRERAFTRSLDFIRASCDESPEGSRRDSPQSLNEIEIASRVSCDPDSRSPVRLVDSDENRPGSLRGCKAHFQTGLEELDKELHSYEWDIIFGADGRTNILSPFFPRKEFRGRLAIAITANFINRQTPAEACVQEISGLSYIYNQDMFNALAYDTNIELENICYYKDDTHYFVMTAKKKSLLERGVLRKDFATTQELLSESNVNKQELLNYAKDAARWTTGLEPLDFAVNHYGQEDCAMFDFTSMYAASNACKALRTKAGGLTLMNLVGDSLLEPFWPTGSGCARGFLSAFDAAWMCRQWAVNKCAVLEKNRPSSRSGKSPRPSPSANKHNSEPTTYDRMALSVMAERESIYRILAQTTSENLHQSYTRWTLNPHTRYPNLNRHLVLPSQVENLIVDGGAKPISVRRGSPRDNIRRVKSPKLCLGHVKSLKKLKPLSEQRYQNKSRSKSQLRNTKTNSRFDLTLDDTYFEFERSYQRLAESEASSTYRIKPNRETSDDMFLPSISGTFPSSDKLHKLEARRARDIDECLRQRRQKTQLRVVKDQLIDKYKSELQSHRHSVGESSPVLVGSRALFDQLRLMREQQNEGKENGPRDVAGPLTLLNSIRRCASFAERVKSFESKINSNVSGDSSCANPKTGIDNVKNLPQFATLQQLLINDAKSPKRPEPVKRQKIPVIKLTKDDWNVKCWEERLSSKNNLNKSLSKESNFGGSTKSLNIAFPSHASSNVKCGQPEKQAKAFKDRIRGMAEKLDKVKESQAGAKINSEMKEKTLPAENGVRQKGWINYLKRELNKGDGRRTHEAQRVAMNPTQPSKPIKKLFDDDDDGEDDVHFDHLCVNRPTNKYLSRNVYTSHLVRTKYNKDTSRVINTKPPIQRVDVRAMCSTDSSASSETSDISRIIASSTDPPKQPQFKSNKCFRCRSYVELCEKITISGCLLHTSCLSCAKCGITLRTDEIQQYLDSAHEDDISGEGETGIDFICAICSANATSSGSSSRYLSERSTSLTADDSDEDEGPVRSHKFISSREEFLNERIDYSEIYKNILRQSQSDDYSLSNKSEQQTTTPESTASTPTDGDATSQATSSSSTPNRDQQSDANSNSQRRSDATACSREGLPSASSSPVSITLPVES